jgi:hypothetical protein
MIECQQYDLLNVSALLMLALLLAPGVARWRLIREAAAGGPR